MRTPDSHTRHDAPALLRRFALSICCLGRTHGISGQLLGKSALAVLAWESGCARSGVAWPAGRGELGAGSPRSSIALWRCRCLRWSQRAPTKARNADPTTSPREAAGAGRDGAVLPAPRTRHTVVRTARTGKGTQHGDTDQQLRVLLGPLRPGSPNLWSASSGRGALSVSRPRGRPVDSGPWWRALRVARRMPSGPGSARSAVGRSRSRRCPCGRSARS
jgi:hypothetical protein